MTDPASTPVSAPRVTVQTLASEAKTVGSTQLVEFLDATGRNVADVYRGNTTWTTILRRADLLPSPTTPVPGEAALLKRMHSFLHIDDTERAATYRQFTADDAPGYEDLPEWEQTLARMLFFNLWDKGGFTTYAEGLASLRTQHAVRGELGQLLTHLMRTPRMRAPRPLTGPHAHIPLSIHHAYNRSEILAAMGVARLGGQLPGFFAQGVLWDPANRTDTLLITLNKSERDFSPTVRYKDYALSRTHFHWESQNSIAPTSATGQRYQQHAKQGSHVLLFLRDSKDTASGKAMPWVLLGPATYERHTGSKPMAITWRLHNPLPEPIWSRLPSTLPTA
ncbi:DUF3427 domain-containing protein [Streptomyces sp. SID1328]|uniref:DUF3427 domain-containing protein n=1 Tax=Streptomyces sp. SID1328 TaxID=2690250 RepID=UPI0013682508|nr:DUF3427 domain-containing protein [Streptomyces sp. SID1328]MYV40185.1 DUF3427 domain-containing protein [Streptomyces sp. SID1328]